MEITANVDPGDIDRLSRDVEKRLRTAQRDVGRQVAKTARSAILGDVRGRRPGGLRFGGYRLGARARIDPRGLAVDVEIRATPAGFWAISEHGSVGHEIMPRQRALHFDGIYAAHADHPGTTGRPYWAGAESALERAVFDVIEDTYDEVMVA